MGLVTAVTVVPWVLAVVFDVIPIPNQPLHRFRELARQIVEENRRAVLFLDPCNNATIEYYLGRVLNADADRRSEVKLAGLRFTEVCWKQKLCVYELEDSLYCPFNMERADGTKLRGRPGVEALLESRIPGHRFDFAIHSYRELPVAGMPVARSW